ncbi:MAG: putative transport system substrate-binding protein [Bradyrhizobium sp.]|nr:putative transport system substrate-binding protein [Bradyrhizobium sp.]
MKRREFIALLGGAAASVPFAAGAQAPMPVVGFIHGASPSYLGQFVEALRKGLAEQGFVEGQNLAIEYRWAEGHYERLPALATDLVERKVAAILAMGGTDPARAVKAATSTIPIVFVSAADPVKTGLVASLNRPGGNVTGVSLIAAALDEKKLGLLHELVPKTSVIAGLVNPNYPGAKTQADDIQEAARHLGISAIALTAGTDDEIDAAFAEALRQGAGAMLVSSDPFFNSRAGRFVAAAARHSIPVIYPQREYVRGGGMLSYGPDFSDGYRNSGVYVGKILKGAKPAELPVMQPTKFELVINLKTAKALGITVPPTLLATADEVIE